MQVPSRCVDVLVVLTVVVSSAGFAAIAFAESASDSTGALAISFEPLEVQCKGQAIVNEPLLLYVVMRLAGPTSEGIGGVEFRIEGLPPEWQASAMATPANSIVVGDALGDGVVIGFPCQRGANGYVTVLTVLVVPTTPVQDRVLQLLRHAVVGDPAFLCPAAAICLPPDYPMFCVEGGRAVLNPVTLDCDDATAVQASTWSEVKILYAH